MKGVIGCGAILVIFFIIWAFTVNIWFGIFVTVAWFGGLFYLIAKVDEKAEQQDDNILDMLNQKQKELETEGLIESKGARFYGNNHKIVLDQENKQIGIIDLRIDFAKIFSYKDVLEVTLCENGNEVTTTSRTSQIGGALLGSVVAGGVGAVIGGLSGKKQSHQEIDSIYIKVVVNDFDNPVHNFICYDSTVQKKYDITYVAMKKDDPKYNDIMETVNQWYSILKFVIKEADEMDKNESVQQHDEASKLNIADELKSLHELKVQGILTDSEFEKQKEKLLNQ